MSTSRGKDTVSPLDGQCLDSLMEVRPSLNERVENMEASDASDLPVIILPGPNQATLEQAVRALGRGQGGWVILRKVKEGETQETRLFVEPLAAQSSTRFEAIGDWFLSLLELDLRSLALARFLVGLVFFWDLWVRSRSLVAHYTDNGALPRQTLIEIGMPKVAFSLLLLNGLESWAWAVFALGFCAAVSLAVGFRSRTSCLLCWIVSVSLQVRFPDLLNSGDVLMSIVLFLLSQLPIGDCLSIDAALSPLKPPYTRFVSASTAALLVEFAIIYVSAALTKTGNLWKNGQAIYYAMNIVGISRDPGAGILSDLVVSYPELAQPLTVAVVYFEGIAPLFLFWPFHTLRGPVRVCLVLLFCAMHIAFHITLNLHVFALLSCALWTALLPAWFWDKMRHHTQSVEALCDRLPRLRRVVRIPPSSRPRRNTSHILMQVLGVVTVLLLLYSAARDTLKIQDISVRPCNDAIEFLRLRQNWKVFAPNPSSTSHVFRLVNGTSGDGTPIHLNQERFGFSAFGMAGGHYANALWTKMFSRINTGDHKKKKLVQYGRMICRHYNGEKNTPDKMLQTFQITSSNIQTSPPGQKTPPPKEEVVWRHSCW